MASLDTGVRKHLTAAASSSAVYVEPGYLLFRRDRYLVAQPFDARRLELTADPRPIAEDVWYEPAVTALTNVSVSDTGMVVFRTGGPELTELAWFERSGQAAGTVWEAKGYNTVVLSPDGTQVLTSLAAEGAERYVWLYDIATATARQMTSSGDAAGNLLLSGDGTRGVFGIVAGLRISMSVAHLGGGAAPEPVPAPTSATGYTDAFDWRGAAIVYGRPSQDGRTSDIYLYDLERGSARALVDTPSDQYFGVISPDGRWLAYASNETGQWDVYVQTFPGPGGRWRVTTDGGHQPRWNPRGGELLYLAPDRRMMSVGVRAGGPVQWDTPRPLFQTDIVDLGPYRAAWGYAVAPDGNRFLILTRRPQGSSPAVAIVNWR